MPVLKNVPVSWASVIKPNTQFSPQWEIQVELTKEQANTLQEEAKALHKKGIKFKEEDGKIFYRFRRRVERADGKGENNPPVVLDTDGSAMVRLIGNGSICNVQYSFSTYDNKFGKGVTNDLKGVRVITLVPFGEQDGEGLMDDDDTPKSSKSSKSSDEWDDDEDL